MMSRLVWAAAAAVAGAASAAPALAQAAGAAPGWNDSATTVLVARAVERRVQQLADTGLRDYTARATGYLTFLGQLGEGFTEPPRILKADQLALEVYWRAPDQSKQRIVGRRDTLLLPTDINYHRDHLGIIQNNFPGIIRLGDGDEVRDVPHPLSPAGLGTYDFRIRDSLRINLPGRVLEVSEVMVRPKDDREARVIGSVFIERTDAQVVRMAFGFTRAAFLDRQLEDLSIVLENGLVETRFWLPRRQEIEIRRAGTWLDYPARGIIRGRWEIGDYALNTGLPPARFAGPEIVSAPAAEVRAYRWEGAVLDSLPPDVRATVDADIARVQEEARTLVRAQALQRASGPLLSARAVSDLVRSNRAEGLAIGVGLSRRLGAGFSIGTAVRYGIDDERAKGSVSLAWRRASGAGIRLRAYSDHAEAADIAERSGVVNSIASQEFGSDYTDPYRVSGGGVELTSRRRAGVDWTLGVYAERHRGLEVAGVPASGTHAGLIAIPSLEARRASVSASRPTMLGPWGIELQFAAELRTTHFAAEDGSAVDLPSGADGLLTGGGTESRVTRGAMQLRLERPFGTRRLTSSTYAAAAGGSAGIPAHELVYLGGPRSAAGYGFHSLVGTAAASQRIELSQPVPFIGIPMGRFGASPAEARLAPYAEVAVVGRRAGVLPFRRGTDGAPVPTGSPATAGVQAYPSVGVGVLLFFDLVRIDVARGLRNGRWAFGVDVSRDFWSIL